MVTAKKVYYTVCCEAIFNRHQDVFRTALVPFGEGDARKPVIIVEPKQGKMPLNKADKKRFISELLELGKSSDLTADITEILFHESFPVDIRHNAKIFREKLAVWATDNLK